MKKLSFLFLSFYLALINLTAQDIVFTFNAKDASNTIDSIKATKLETGETAFVEGSNRAKRLANICYFLPTFRRMSLSLKQILEEPYAVKVARTVLRGRKLPGANI